MINKESGFPWNKLIAYLEVWLQLFFKVLFTQKYIKIIFFFFLKVFFDISILKWYKNTKKILIWKKN